MAAILIAPLYIRTTDKSALDLEICFIKQDGFRGIRKKYITIDILPRIPMQSFQEFILKSRHIASKGLNIVYKFILSHTIYVFPRTLQKLCVLK
jgi:hypothetical protein